LNGQALSEDKVVVPGRRKDLDGASLVLWSPFLNIQTDDVELHFKQTK